MQVIGSQWVRERGEEGQGTPAAAVSRVPLSPLARSLLAAAYFAILGCLSLSRSPLRPACQRARPPAGMKRVRHFVRPSVAAQADARRDGGTPAKRRPLTPYYAARARDPFPFVREISADAMLPPYLYKLPRFRMLARTFPGPKIEDKFIRFLLN